MDLKKFQLFKTGGLSEREREKMEEFESAENKFKEERALVRETARTKGFRMIIDLLYTEIEYEKEKLVRCDVKEFKDIQNRIEAKRKFLDAWSPYME